MPEYAVDFPEARIRVLRRLGTMLHVIGHQTVRPLWAGLRRTRQSDTLKPDSSAHETIQAPGRSPYARFWFLLPQDKRNSPKAKQDGVGAKSA